MDGAGLLGDLHARGLVHDHTDRDALAADLDRGPLTVYAGFDPTADSLHIGHLVPLSLLRRSQEADHRPIALAGGPTGMVGDPGGRSEERNLLDEAALAANLAGIRPQLERLLDFGAGPTGAPLVDNQEWTAPVGVLDFLREVGKHVTVGQMLAKESVRARLDGPTGLSYTEFSYMLLQAFDYWWLHRHHGCSLQVGGSDQWGNITAGIDLVRRRSGAAVHGLTVPLITRADGAKFGKTAEGAVWLDPARTSPYRFFQYWMQTDDRDVERFLLQLTFLAVDEARSVAAAHAEVPERRDGQRRLARELTALVHGPGQAEAAEGASEIPFGGGVEAVSGATLEQLEGEVPTASLDPDRLSAGLDVADLMVLAGLEPSLTRARKAGDQGGAYVNNVRAVDGQRVGPDHLLAGRALLVRRGKRSYALVVADPRP